MSIEINYEALSELSIADLYAISECYTIKLENTEVPYEISVYNQALDATLKQLNIKLRNIFIY